MTTYVDSSALVPIYVPERFSDAARSAVRAAGQIPFTAVHRLEVSNAFELLAGRKLITPKERRAVQRQLRDDIESQRLLPVALDFEDVFANAVVLSASHSARLLTRSLDLAHVAAARALNCQTFVSADDRRLKLARAAGLKPVDIKRRPRRRTTRRARSIASPAAG